MFYKASLISRPKLNMCGMHYGVKLGDTTVMDPQKDGIKIITPDDFAKGFSVKVESFRDIPFYEIASIQERINKFKYDLFEDNCEHFSRDLVERKRESRQINFLIGGGIALLILWIIMRE